MKIMVFIKIKCREAFHTVFLKIRCNHYCFVENSLPSLNTSQSQFPLIPLLLGPQHTPPFFSRSTPHFLFRKRAGLQKIAVKQNKIGYNKARQNPWYWAWIRQPNRKKRKGKIEEAKKPGTHSLPFLGVSREHQVNDHDIHTEDLVQIH